MTRSCRALWPPTFEQLHAAWSKAAAGKRRRVDVCAFEVRLAERLVELGGALATGAWRPGRYRIFEVVERGKVRVVAAAPFADRVVHHAVVDVLAPVWEARFVDWSCANRVGRGTHDAMRRARAGVARFRHALVVDVARFFPSVDHGVVKALCRRHVRGRLLLETVDRIVDSGRGLFAPEEARPWVPVDEGLLALARPRGLPIGNQTSQFLANVVLHPVDLVIAHEVNPGAAVRYVDDWVVFDNDRGRLEAARARIEQALHGLRLRAHPEKTRLVDTRQGVTFVGYRLVADGAGGAQVRLPRSTLSRFHRRVHALQRAWARGSITLDEVRASLAGMAGHARPAHLEDVMDALLAAHPFVREGEDHHDDDTGDDA